MADQLLHPGVLDEGVAIRALHFRSAPHGQDDLPTGGSDSGAGEARRDARGTTTGPTLPEALVEVVDQGRCDVVLIVDEVPQAIVSDNGQQSLLALKSARDAINPRKDTPGHFLFVGTGPHRALVGELTARRNRAFVAATSIGFPYSMPMTSTFCCSGSRMPRGGDPNVFLPVVAATLRSAAADDELMKVEQLGTLALVS